MNVNMILVGSNPMPCYVQAAYLMEPGRDEDELLPVPDLHILLYTKETEKFKGNLIHALCKKNVLQKDQNGELKKRDAEAYQVGRGMKRRIRTWEERTLPEDQNYRAYRNTQIEQIKLRDISNPMMIMDDLGNLEELFSRLTDNRMDIRKVILNNTGGTKTMATYVTLWLRQKACSPGYNFSLTECYVDDKNKKLCCYIHGETKETCFQTYPSVNLTDIVVLRIPEVARLHGFGSYSSKEPYFAANEERREAVRYFAGKIFDESEEKLHSAEGEEPRVYYERYSKLLSRYRYLQNRELKKYFKGLCVDHSQYLFDGLSKNTDLGEIIKEKERLLYHNSIELADDLRRILCSPERTDDRSQGSGSKNPAGDSHPFLEKDSQRLLTGEWLEAYFYIAVKEAIRRSGKKNVDLAWSVVIDAEGDTNNPKNFELDVVVCVGYELKILSITTDDTPGGGKLKYFEALFRGEIISGSHSQVIAVNLIDTDNREMTRIRDDLRSFSAANYRQAEVWGKQDISDYEILVDKIKRILTMG